MISVEMGSWFIKERSAYLGRLGGTEVKNRLGAICHSQALLAMFLYWVSSLEALFCPEPLAAEGFRQIAPSA